METRNRAYLHSATWAVVAMGLSSLVILAAASTARAAGDRNIQEETTQLRPEEDMVRTYFASSLAFDGEMLVGGTPGAILAEHDYKDAGAVNVYVRRRSGWTKPTEVTADSPVDGSGFGSAVAVDEGTMLVGADGYFDERGIVHVFTRSSGTWNQQATLEPTDASDDAQFGSAVEIDGDLAVVGAFFEAHQGDDAPGRVYIFRRNDGTWSLERELSPPDPSVYGQFGTSIALQDQQLVVGKPSAAVYVYRYREGEWKRVQKLAPPEDEDGATFGEALSLDGERLLVGNPGSNESGKPDVGSAYVYRRDDGTWGDSQELVPGAAREEQLFGHSLALDGNVVLVGATGTISRDSDEDAGAAYLFAWTGTEWKQQAEYRGSDTRKGVEFGTSAVLEGDRAALGAPHADGGTAYLFDVETDADDVPHGEDNCPVDANSDQSDRDGDGVGDVCDGCPEDPNKVSPGSCGCGNPDVDTDGDGKLDCNDRCPETPGDAGACGCASCDDTGVGMSDTSMQTSEDSGRRNGGSSSDFGNDVKVVTVQSDSADNSQSGCSCRQSGRAPLGSAFVLAGLLVGLRWRRARPGG